MNKKESAVHKSKGNPGVVASCDVKEKREGQMRLVSFC